MDWLDLLAVQGTLKSLLQRHISKASILQRSAFFMVQLSHLDMTTGKTIALMIQTFVSKVMSLLFNMLSRFVMAFFPRSKCLLISWLQSPSAVITSWQIGEKEEAGTDLLFLDSAIIEEYGCSPEIKRHLLLGKKAMTNLHSILKIRDISL